MKATVISAFIDKHTRQKYLAGSEYEGEFSRINELVKAGHVSKTETKEVEPEKVEEQKPRRTRRKKG